MVELLLKNWRVNQAQHSAENYFYEGTILTKLHSVLGMHYFPMLNFNSQREGYVL